MLSRREYKHASLLYSLTLHQNAPNEFTIATEDEGAIRIQWVVTGIHRYNFTIFWPY